MEYNIEKPKEVSLSIDSDVPCFIMEDGTIKRSKAPSLFNTDAGVLSYADDYMAKLQSLYSSEEEMRTHASQKISEYSLLDDPLSDQYSIWLLVAMTID